MYYSPTSASNITLGLESNSANWPVWAKGTNYLENWTAITNYKENDVVKYGGTVYICLTAHTSDTVTNGLEQDHQNGLCTIEVIFGKVYGK